MKESDLAELARAADEYEAKDQEEGLEFLANMVPDIRAEIQRRSEG